MLYEYMTGAAIFSVFLSQPLWQQTAANESPFSFSPYYGLLKLMSMAGEFRMDSLSKLKLAPYLVNSS